MDFLLLWTIVILFLAMVIGLARKLGNSREWTDLIAIPLLVVLAIVIAFVFSLLLLFDVLFPKKTVIDEAIVDCVSSGSNETTFYFKNSKRKVVLNKRLYSKEIFKYTNKCVEILKVEARCTGWYGFETIRLLK
jgi:hypothetical protein